MTCASAAEKWKTMTVEERAPWQQRCIDYNCGLLNADS